jgi:gluconolactonase
MIFAKGLQNPEGPVALPDGSWVIVEGSADRGCITHISADGATRRVVKKTGRPNGLALDADGVIWAAESKVPSLLRVTMEGNSEVVAAGCNGEAFLFPNDLCFGPDGALYMTDSGVIIDNFAPNNQIRPDYRDISYDGRVYRIDVQTGKVTKIDGGIKFTNGIAFGPDRLLYVNETLTGAIYRYEWKDGAISGPRTLFGNVNDPAGPPGWRGPDGMAFSTDGRLYVAVFGQHDVTVLGKNGDVLERIRTAGKLPTNLAFGLPASKRIHVTEYELGQMEAFDVGTDGLPLWTGLKRTGTAD